MRKGAVLIALSNKSRPNDRSVSQVSLKYQPLVSAECWDSISWVLIKYSLACILGKRQPMSVDMMTKCGLTYWPILGLDQHVNR